MALVNHCSKLVLGNFNSEEYWRDRDYALLPFFNDPQTDAIISVMDEVQFPFCNNKNDLLITRYPINDIHKNYLNDLGFQFINNSVSFNLNGDTKRNIFEILIDPNNHDYLQKIISDEFSISPFSVIPKAHDFCSKYAIDCFLPAIDCVSLVNSKLFSHKLNSDLLGLSYSHEVKSIEDLVSIGKKLLSAHKAFLIKDLFGVSGKGNIIINSLGILENIKNHLTRQEKKGKIVCFILEPLFEKKIDFSCQFEISKNNSCKIIAIHEMENEGFAFSKIKAASEGLLQSLEKADYFEKVNSISEAIYNAGYHGPVCLDSMITTNDEIVQIIEINARKSMGFINHSIDKYLSQFNKRGKMVSLFVGVNTGFSIDDFFKILDDENILFRHNRPYGIIPLTTTTIVINEGSDEMPYKGRFYCSLIANGVYSENYIMQKIKLIFDGIGVKVY